MSLYAEYLRERTNDEIIEWDDGFATYRYLNDNQVYIIDIFVQERGRKKGVGRKLMDEIATIAKQKGYTEMVGTIIPSTKGSTLSLEGLLYHKMKLVSASENLIIMKKEI